MTFSITGKYLKALSLSKHILVYTFIAFYFILSISCSKKSNEEAPDEYRFRKVVLLEGMENPLELQVADNGRIYFIQSNGFIKAFDQNDKHVKPIGKLETFDGGEFGLIGMALDPQFTKNGFIYLQYFPKDTNVRYGSISRFTIKDVYKDLL